ncbi:MAG: glycosyltransferase family 2 protein [Paracoccaceae bacterium]
MKTISISSPCYNEQENVEECYRIVKELFDGPLKKYRREHIFIDNSSTDQTVEILKEIAAKDPAVKLVVNARNFGIFRSSFNGLKYTTGDAVLVMLPVDLQDPPDLLPEFVNLWEQGYEIVAGARTGREEGFVMRSVRKLFYRIVNRLSDFEISPDVGEFQLLDRKVMDALLEHKDQYPYIRGIIASLGFRRIIVPYTWRERERGVSKHSFFMLVDQALNGIFSFTRAPLRFCTISGLVISLASIAFSIFSVLYYFINPEVASRGITTIIIALFFLSGIQLLFIGMLGEYVTAIHNQVRGGPMVVERERVNIDAKPKRKTKST